MKRCISLFTGGVAGFDLAAEWMGWEVLLMCERDPACQLLLKQNFPGIPIHSDVCTLNLTPYYGTVDVVFGGFPCQPHSLAGKRLGKDDERHLWSEMRRCYNEARPRWVIGENVLGIVTTELDSILADLEEDGYTARTFVISAQCLGSPFDGKRVIIMAQANDWSEPVRGNGQLQATTQTQGRRDYHGRRTQEFVSGQWWKIQPRPNGVADGIPNRVERIKMIGNAVQPQLAYEVFRAIELIESV